MVLPIVVDVETHIILLLMLGTCYCLFLADVIANFYDRCYCHEFRLMLLPVYCLWLMLLPYILADVIANLCGRC